MTEESLRSINLEDTFSLNGDLSKQYIVKLSPTIISIRLLNSNNSINENNPASNNHLFIDDIYGCLCMKAKNNSIQCHLNLYLYTLKASRSIRSPFSKEKYFERSNITLTYGKHNDFLTNLTEITRWYRLITNAIYLRRNLPPDIVMTKRDKPVLVFVNPAGGAGKAYRLVMEYVVGVWSEAEFHYHIIITEYVGHARDYVKAIQLADWSGIVLASGDGLVYEVINGLMSRNDWQDAFKLPIGHLPCGSGNAFITNIMRYSKQPIMETMEKFVVQSAVLIATHSVIPFDLTILDICDGRRLFSFLCIEWAIVADVDCESEQYRFLGEARFTVEAVKRIILLRVYNGYIDYIPYEQSDDNLNRNQTSTDPLYQYLLPLDQPIPTDSTTTKWRRINGPFAHVLITSKCSISKNVVASPQSTLSDGYLTLQYIRSNSSTRMNLTKTFSKLSDGKHFDYDFVEWMHIRAFRIVPSDNNGNMMVDGEKIPYGPIQGETLAGIAQCMGKYPRMD